MPVSAIPTAKLSCPPPAPRGWALPWHSRAPGTPPAPQDRNHPLPQPPTPHKCPPPRPLWPDVSLSGEWGPSNLHQPEARQAGWHGLAPRKSTILLQVSHCQSEVKLCRIYPCRLLNLAWLFSPQMSNTVFLEPVDNIFPWQRLSPGCLCQN